MTFEHSISEEDGIQTVYFKGQLIERTQSVDLVADVVKLLEQKQLKFIFDLTDLRYMNSSGLNVLINLLTKARREGGEVVIANVNSKIRELLIITKLTSMFTVTDSHEVAVAKLK
ncbi:MAG: STAS domain-containing protein [Bacteroidota bacterium]|nr:STAS domain-containing protein [Bacteroidota bacterium]